MRLGSITFRDFEVASGVSFGGRQELVTHRLGNGRRVIDVLGPEAANIRFSGTFSGQDAVRRAQALDLIRKAGRPVELSWGTLRYKVVVSRFSASYETKTWIPYEATCTVIQDDLRGYNRQQASSNELATSMLSAAVTLLATVTEAAVLIPGLGLPDDGLANIGQSAVDAASLSLVQANISATLLSCEVQFSSINTLGQQSTPAAIAMLGQIGQSCQTMCTLVAAQSYLAVAGLTTEAP